MQVNENKIGFQVGELWPGDGPVMTEESMHVHYQPPLTLPQVTPDLLQIAAQASVCIEGSGANRRFVRYAPEFIDDPSLTGLFAGLGADIYVSPPAFLSTLPRPTLFDYRSLAWNGRFCTDEAGTDPLATEQFLRALPVEDPLLNEDTGLRLAPDGNGFDLDVEGRPQRICSPSLKFSRGIDDWQMAACA